MSHRAAACMGRAPTVTGNNEAMPNPIRRPRASGPRTLRTWIAAMFAMLLLANAPATALAHGASSSYLTVTLEGRDLEVQWEIALRDLDYAVGIDARGDGVITWGDLRRQLPAIEAYAMPRLALSGDGRACAPGPVRLLSDQRGDGAYAVLRFTAACPAAVHRAGVDYHLLFELDPMHRGLLDFVSGGVSHPVALSPRTPSVAFDAGGSLGTTFATFFATGVAHIFSGFDHLLFVAVLLLPAMFRRRHGRGDGQEDGRGEWQPVARFRPAFLETVRILSAFTLAHGITLTAATLGFIQLPSALVEGAIALTIAVTAFDNIVPILPGPRWPLAFGFGLIHGLGFASALGPLALPPLATAAALVSFNLGIETGQLAVAALVLPVGFVLRGLPLYPRRLLPGASGVAALLALVWFAERAFGLSLLRF